MATRTTGRLGTFLGLTALAGVIWYAAGTTVGAHDFRAGQVIFTAGQPITGQPVDVTLSIQGLGGLPASLRNSRVVISADMTAHRMTPVTAELKTELPDYKRGGRIAFTMPGDWRITVKVIEASEAERVAVFPLTVLRSDAVPATTSLAIGVELNTAPRPTVFEPWNVVWATVALILLFEALAVVGYFRRLGRETAGAGQPVNAARETVGE